MSEHDLREGSKPRCPNCGSKELRLSESKNYVYCATQHAIAIGSTADFAQFFPIAAILEENQREVDKWRTLYYEAEEYACSCHEPHGIVCDFHEHHPNVEADKEVFGLANRAEKAEAENQRLAKELEEAKQANHRAFVMGAKWWEFSRPEGGTMWLSDQATAMQEAEKQWPYVESALLRVETLAREAAEAKLGKMREVLTLMYDRWENGIDCYEGADTDGEYLGKSFQLSEEEENKIVAALAE